MGIFLPKAKANLQLLRNYDHCLLPGSGKKSICHWNSCCTYAVDVRYNNTASFRWEQHSELQLIVVTEHTCNSSFRCFQAFVYLHRALALLRVCFAVLTGEVFGWGCNTNCQLGDGDDAKEPIHLHLPGRCVTLTPPEQYFNVRNVVQTSDKSLLSHVHKQLRFGSSTLVSTLSVRSRSVLMSAIEWFSGLQKWKFVCWIIRLYFLPEPIYE